MNKYLLIIAIFLTISVSAGSTYGQEYPVKTKVSQDHPYRSYIYKCDSLDFVVKKFSDNNLLKIQLLIDGVDCFSDTGKLQLVFYQDKKTEFYLFGDEFNEYHTFQLIVSSNTDAESEIEVQLSCYISETEYMKLLDKKITHIAYSALN